MQTGIFPNQPKRNRTLKAFTIRSVIGREREGAYENTKNLDDRKRLALPSLAGLSRSLSLRLLVDPAALVAGVGNQHRVTLRDELELRVGLAGFARGLVLFALKHLLEYFSSGLVAGGLGVVHAVAGGNFEKG
jgi:hypothetical protein